MDTKPSRNYHQGTDSNCNKCVEPTGPTQISINKQRVPICDSLYESAGNTRKLEKRFDGEKIVFGDKKTLFENTEDNYQRYRNLDIYFGTELLQTNDAVKTNLATYNKLNKDLNAALKNIAKSIKDVKGKFADFKSTACKLDDCIKDSCNTAQWRALTVKPPDQAKQQSQYKEKDSKKTDYCPEVAITDGPCKDAKAIFSDLICKPNGLSLDIDSIFKSSSDVVGIQLFSNIESLDPLQKTLEEKGKAFEKHISDITKLRKGELDKLQDDLVKSVQEITKANIERNQERSNYDGYIDATTFLCCTDTHCCCIVPYKEDPCPPGDDIHKICYGELGGCEQSICVICDGVQQAFCCPIEDDSKTNPGC